MKYFLFFFSLCSIAFSQEKRAITHDDYDLWKRISETKISAKGNILLNEVKTTTGRSNGYLQIDLLTKNFSKQFFNGTDAQITQDEKFIVFLEQPHYDSIRNQKKREVKKEKQTKPKLKIFSVEKQTLIDSIEAVKKFHIPEEAEAWVVIEKYKDKKQKAKQENTLKKRRKKKKKKEEEKTPLNEKADYAIVYNLSTQQRDSVFQVDEIELPKSANHFYFTKTKGKKKAALGIFKYDISNLKEEVIDSSYYRYQKVSASNTGENLAFYAAKDSTEKDSLQYELLHFNQKLITQVTDTTGFNLRENWQVSTYQKPSFSENEERLYFYSKPIPDFKIDTTLLKDEIPEVDVWTYKDQRIQPEQKARAKQLENEAFVSYYNLAENRLVHLQDKQLDGIYFDKDKQQKWILGYTDEAYRLQRSWSYPWLTDWYLVNAETGEKTIVLEALAQRPYLSPDGKFALYYNTDDKNWWSVNLASQEKKSLTKDLAINFFDEENDTPSAPRAYGFGGFTANNEALVYDEFDVWQLDLSGNKQPEKLTNGRAHFEQLRTLQLDPEDPNLASYYQNELLLTSFGKYTKQEALFSLKNNKEIRVLVKKDAHSLIGLAKAEAAEQLVFRKQDFKKYPDVYVLNSNQKHEQITHINPQQQDFLWGNVELVNWEAYDGTKLQGLLYKPENFDESKKYPMITYFYEKRSDNLHRYISPQPSASIVNMSYLVSNDYLVFVPDIVYQQGKPGASAENCILSGVEAMEKLPYVDSDKLAIQGQSWGGYQVAHLITKTDKFAAAGSGAPVSNMTSAYGGIRWASGLSRQFQYERTQSRIGTTLWEDVDLYIENSPLFGIPEITTPVLIMHNDADGAVPYYQGIEFFMGLRRLQKPAWLLVYNNEAHNLRKMKNKQDLSIRMMQFFDHFLKDEAQPVWMKQGLPRIKKAKDLGYDLTDK
ncbi:S9 family peptidase [Psychroflexus salis]|uniref:Peptidase S9 n=1 Tax=Psychroflexus salis TaxID=1526574 RepID=A0A917E5Y4_9FLAO|nr:prolyl oligopeptidase family serine peptidase [Psychroflexus salis]GGE02714.1 peptidase S9 [Psychroflexus salis]